MIEFDNNYEVGSVIYDIESNMSYIKSNDGWKQLTKSDFVSTDESCVGIGVVSSRKDPFESYSDATIDMSNSWYSDWEISRFISEHREEIADLPDAFTAVEWALKNIK